MALMNQGVIRVGLLLPQIYRYGKFFKMYFELINSSHLSPFFHLIYPLRTVTFSNFSILIAIGYIFQHFSGSVD